MSKAGGIDAALTGAGSFERVSTVDQVADLLRDLILRGKLKPGSRLPEIPLSQSLGVSRNTVREAIPILAAEGLLRRELHRGAVVVALEPSDVEDLYRVRRVIELSGVELADDGDFTRIRESTEEMDAASRAGDRRRMSEADADFHSAVAALVGSPRLDRFFSQIASEMILAIAILTSESDDPAEADENLAEEDDLIKVAAEHREIYEDLAAGNPEGAKRRLRNHLDRNEVRLSAIMRQRLASNVD